MQKKIIIICCIIILIVIYFFHFRNIMFCKNIIKSNLIDPKSVIFSEITYSTKGDAVCGYYNSRNRFGGYVGNKKFVCKYNDNYRTIYNYTESVEHLEALFDFYMEEFIKAKSLEEKVDIIRKRGYFITDEEFDLISDNKTVKEYCKIK